MQRIFNFLFSTRFTAVLLFIFAYAIAAATFIEDQYGTTTARIEIFRSKWLELVMILLVVNFLGNIKKYNMISAKKWPSLLFHLSFVVIIIGAGFTRYFGYEGMMPIREGETTNVMYSAEPYLQFAIVDPTKPEEDPKGSLGYSEPKLMAATTDNDFFIPFDFGDKQASISYVDYIENAEYEILENVQGGTDVLEVVTTSNGQRESVFIESGKAERVGTVLISFNEPGIKGAVAIMESADTFLIYSPYQIPRMRMIDQMKDTVQPGVMAPMYFRQAHEINGTIIVFAKKMENTVKRLVSREAETKLGHALKVKVKVGDDVTERLLFGGPERVGTSEYFNFMGLNFRASYGSKPIYLPFKLRLDDFVLERYPGSNNPSGYRSEVTLYDEEKGLTEQHGIFMNNVLDYRGFRFFQSSYDPDEGGTRLSVNHDALGTNVTYIGYLLLAVGFVLSLFNKNSRFVDLIKKARALRKKRIGAGLNTLEDVLKGDKLTLVVVGLLMTFSVSAHDGHDHDGHSHGMPAPNTSKVFDNGSERIPVDHAEKFGKLLVQSVDGRFEPINTLALDVMHKIVHEDKLVIDSVGTFTPEQFLLEMIINGRLFEDKRIIYARDDSLRAFLGVKGGKYVSFMDFFEGGEKSKIYDQAQQAMQKDPKKRNRWDKEIIKIGDKFETFYKAQRAELLRLFPTLDSTQNNKWVSVYEPEANKSLKELLGDRYNTEGLPDVSYAKLLSSYFIALRKENYKDAEMYLGIISSLQRKLTPENILPSEGKVDLEIGYNQSNMFNKIKKYYMYLFLLIGIWAFIEADSKDRTSKRFKLGIQYPLYFLTSLFAVVFAYHTYGLAVRWYLTDHAPWSNGYEALIFIAWGTALAGLVFSKFSKITLAGTAKVAFLIIMTAGHENMDPQLTQLVPVLKSYWLVIHVACITTSYAFFGLGAILGLFSLATMLFKNDKNYKRINDLTSEWTYINEMTVTIGVVLATVGTFLGGVWANESWGRYWGWDAKETWALIIVIVYAMLLHFRFIPGIVRTKHFFNSFGTVVGFGTVCMTFFGVNFYFSNSIHSYAAGDPPAFPVWLWVTIISIVSLCVAAGIKETHFDKKLKEKKS